MIMKLFQKKNIKTKKTLKSKNKSKEKTAKIKEQKPSINNKKIDKNKINKDGSTKSELHNKNLSESNLKPITLIENRNLLVKDNKNNTKNLVLVRKSDNSFDEPKEIIVNNQTSNSLIENIQDREELIKNNDVVGYKIQFGAFGKFSNADKFLSELMNMDIEQVKLIIEEDFNTGLFKIKSVKSYSKDQGKNICNNFKNININCILSQI